MKKLIEKGYARHAFGLTALFYVAIMIMAEGWINPGLKSLSQDLIRFASESIFTMIFLAVPLCLGGLFVGVLNEKLQEILGKGKFDWNDAKATGVGGLFVIPLLCLTGTLKIVALVVCSCVTAYIIYYLFILLKEQIKINFKL